MNFIKVCQASGLNHSSLMNFFYLFMDVLKCSSFGWRDRIQVSFKISSFVFEYESLLGLDWREGEYILEF